MGMTNRTSDLVAEFVLDTAEMIPDRVLLLSSGTKNRIPTSDLARLRARQLVPQYVSTHVDGVLFAPRASYHATDRVRSCRFGLWGRCRRSALDEPGFDMNTCMEQLPRICPKVSPPTRCRSLARYTNN